MDDLEHLLNSGLYPACISQIVHWGDLGNLENMVELSSALIILIYETRQYIPLSSVPTLNAEWSLSTGYASKFKRFVLQNVLETGATMTK